MPKKSNALVLGQLDKCTLLVATENSFVIKERLKTKDGDTWVGKYYYTELGDAIRGYAKHKLRSADGTQKLDGSLGNLIATLEHLENTITDISTKLSQAWNLRIQDPVESHILSGCTNDRT